MYWLGFKRLLCFISAFLLACPSWSNTDTESNFKTSGERVPFHSAYHLATGAYWSPIDFVNNRESVSDIVGVPVARGTDEEVLQQFRAQVEKLVSEGNIDLLKGTRITVAGVNSTNKASQRQAYLQILEQAGLQQDEIKLKIIDIPKDKLDGLTTESLRVLLQRVKYWFPSFERHFVRPDRNEVVSGLRATVISEIGAAIYLGGNLDGPEFGLTLTVHAAILASYIIFTRSLLNWVTDPGTGTFASFVKGMVTTMPFVLNYNISPNIEPISEFMRENTLADSIERFGQESVNFVATQWITTFIHAAMMWAVQSRTVGRWEKQQKNLYESSVVRGFTKDILIPLHVLGAVVLAKASGVGTEVMLQVGQAQLNTGHVYTLGLLVSGVLAYRYGLDISFSSYLKLKDKFRSANEFFHKKLRDISIHITSKCTAALKKKSHKD